MKLSEHPQSESKLDPITSFFVDRFGREPKSIGYAPGRIEVIGNHVDYNGGSVLGAAVDLGIHVAVARRQDAHCHLASTSFDTKVEAPLDAIQPLDGADSWANYSLGITKILRAEGFPITTGFDLATKGSLPFGAGMSSSAALELATACALAGLFGFDLDRATLARIGRRAENEFVGVPCGILDQGVSSLRSCRPPRSHRLPDRNLPPRPDAQRIPVLDLQFQQKALARRIPLRRPSPRMLRGVRDPASREPRRRLPRPRRSGHRSPTTDRSRRSSLPPRSPHHGRKSTRTIRDRRPRIQRSSYTRQAPHRVPRKLAHLVRKQHSRTRFPR